MKRVPMDKVEAGMVLAKPITSLAGQVIVSAGTSLDAPLIARLRDMGLTSAHVENRPGETGDPVESLAELEQALDQRFRRVAGDPELTRMREAIRRHLRATHRTTV
ncbi:MAG: hypothetical protein KGO52_08970 [Nitrospirota bacterium]|nr:hypothetical protein [Nitrospirota bacterium]MDE3118821.1 hypothetical protein [Nitrospirota bacterium]MDE3226831.1 hypothetical protein [Nitrospirota bacterium]MDE3242834.1 hypothetical protein [Nitrospirota bacterium]